MTDETHIMVDIETLGNDTKTGLIMAIGAVKFNPWCLEKRTVEPLPECNYQSATEFYVILSVENGMLHGFQIDIETYKWWTRPERIQAYAHMRMAKDVQSLYNALRMFAEWCGISDIWCWSHGNTFDGVHLVEKFKYLQIRDSSMRNPLHYRRLMDTRTLFKTHHALLGEDVQWPARQQHHHPLDDARVQVMAVQQAMQNLRCGKVIR